MGDDLEGYVRGMAQELKGDARTVVRAVHEEICNQASRRLSTA